MTASHPPPTQPHGRTGRRVAIWQYLLIIVGYLVVVQGLSALLADGDAPHGTVGSVDALVRSVLVPVALGAAFVVAVAAWIGDWQGLFVDPRRLRTWTLAFGGVLLLGIVAVTNYGGLVQAGALHALTLLAAVLLVGFAEELLFRGIGVRAFRSGGRSEIAVACWTSLIFGIAHGSNAVVTGDIPGALLQVVLTTLTGAVFYLVLRSTGMLVVGMAAHGLWDFGILSTQIDLDDVHEIVNAAPAIVVAILIGALVLRRRLERP